MTEYTVNKDGKVTAKGNGKKPLITKYIEGNIPLTIPKIIKNVKKKIDSFKDKDEKKIGDTLKEKKLKKTLKEKKLKIIEVAKGGMIKGYMSGGEVHMDDSPNSGMITTKGWGKSRAT